MSNEDIIKEELENLGCKVTNVNHSLYTFIDDTGRIKIEVRLYYANNMIWFHVFLTGEYKYITILDSAIIPFNNRESELSKIENILNKNRQFVKKYEQYRKTLSFIRENDESDTIQNEFFSHFSQFGVKKDFGVVVYGYFGKMIIFLDKGLHLVVQVNSFDEYSVRALSVVLNKGNYKRVFDNVDDLIHEFKEKSPNGDTYAGLLKDSI